ncbi:unnamed protein product [Calypogeia fissa]
MVWWCMNQENARICPFILSGLCSYLELSDLCENLLLRVSSTAGGCASAFVYALLQEPGSLYLIYVKAKT